jgi:predicted PurR-regulated permease PerM
VVIVVQQLDNDLLAPVVYGRSLELHPVIVLLAVAGGGALFGLPGTLLAVPVTAVGLNVLAEARRTPAEVPVEA